MAILGPETVTRSAKAARHSARVEFRELKPHLRRLDRLGKSGDEEALIAELRSHVESHGVSVRRRAAQHLGDLRSRRAVQPLIRLLRDRDVGVRVSAARALGKIGDRAAVPALIELLRDPSRFVRPVAITSLGEIRDPAAVPHLLPFLAEPSWMWGRSSAVYALLLVDDVDANEAARRQLAEESWFLRRAVVKDVRKYRRRAGAPGRDADR